MNRSDIRDAVREETVMGSDDITDAKLNLQIGRGVYDMAGRYNWPFLQTTSPVDTTAGVQGYALPSNFLRMEAVSRAGKTTLLEQITFRDALALYGNSPPQGADATMFTLRGDNILFLPVPEATETGAYNLYYWRKPDLLTNDTSEPEWSPVFHWILVDYATWWVWRQQEDLDKAEEARTRYFDALDTMARMHMQRAVDVPYVYSGGGSVLPRARTNTPFLDG